MNTNAKHTPGPWQYSPGHDPHNQAQIYGENGKTLAITYSDEGSANAQLIAAAPALLEALRECITEPGAACWKKREYAEKRIRYIDQMARAAISQAEGGAQ